ncbi:MAG: TPM domain-containing protein [Lachnospiraceae bacterium]|nr:TPM domain-containing protein [Lachnospiraceae bacterium]
MDQDVRKEALRQYVHYFRVWFVLAGIALAVIVGSLVTYYIKTHRHAVRSNTRAIAERVFDQADVLTDEEEQKLRAYIAECEAQGEIDIIVVTTNEPMGLSDYQWETNMMNYADDFYDNYAFGWDQPYGDGALLLDNWYEDENGSQKGSWLSTSGKMEETIGSYEEGKVFDAMDPYIGSSPYMAYHAAVGKLAQYGKNGYEVSSSDLSCSVLCIGGILPFIIALIYALSHLKQTPAKDTTVPSTYVVQGRTTMHQKTDAFLRKNTITRHIDTSSGGGSRSGGHSGGGSYGNHTSSGGHSHGGGGRRR